MNSTGSPQQGEPLYLVVGQVKKLHGLQGEVLVDVLTDFPERLKKGKVVYLGDDRRSEEIASARPHNRGLIMRFIGRETPEDVEQLRGEIIYVKSEDLPKLPAGEYYFHQLVGLAVYDEQDNYLGELDQILETGANDVYLIKTPDDKELLVPAIDEVIKKINLRKKKIIISPPEWY